MSVTFDVENCSHEELVNYLCNKRFYIRTEGRFGIRSVDEERVLFYVDEEDPESSTNEQLHNEARYGLTAPELAEMFHQHKPNNKFYFTWCDISDMDWVYTLLYRHVTLMSNLMNTSLRGVDSNTENELEVLDEFLRFLYPKVSYRVQEKYNEAYLNRLRPKGDISINPFKRPARYVHKDGQRVAVESEVIHQPQTIKKDEYQSPISPTGESSNNFANRVSRWSK